MKILYCDDSFFLDTSFSKKMKHKLEVIIREEDIRVVCISIQNDVHQSIDEMAKIFAQTTFIKSCIRIKFEEHEFVLNQNSISFLDRQIVPLSGSICLIDTLTLEWNRIYLELFPDQETDTKMIIENGFEDFLHDLLFKDQKVN